MPFFLRLSLYTHRSQSYQYTPSYTQETLVHTHVHHKVSCKLMPVLFHTVYRGSTGKKRESRGLPFISGIVLRISTKHRPLTLPTRQKYHPAITRKDIGDPNRSPVDPLLHFLNEIFCAVNRSVLTLGGLPTACCRGTQRDFGVRHVFIAIHRKSLDRSPEGTARGAIRI